MQLYTSWATAQAVCDGRIERRMANQIDIWPGICRLVAPNPSAARAEGTNSYAVATPNGALIIDPGSADAGHLGALMSAGPIEGILVTHGHPDHSEGVAELARASGAPVYAFGGSEQLGPLTDRPLQNGDRVGPLEAIHTPGHAADHLCFALGEEAIFTGDVVMQWATSFVPAVSGSMRAYLASLDVLLARPARVLLPGHGEPVAAPAERLRDLLDTRLRREQEILAALHVPRTAEDLVACLYSPSRQTTFRRLALQTVTAHLIKLEEDGRASALPDGRWSLTAP